MAQNQKKFEDRYNNFTTLGSNRNYSLDELFSTLQALGRTTGGKKFGSHKLTEYLKNNNITIDGVNKDAGIPYGNKLSDLRTKLENAGLIDRGQQKNDAQGNQGQKDKGQPGQQRASCISVDDFPEENVVTLLSQGVTDFKNFVERFDTYSEIKLLKIFKDMKETPNGKKIFQYFKTHPEELVALKFKPTEQGGKAKSLFSLFIGENTFDLDPVGTKKSAILRPITDADADVRLDMISDQKEIDDLMTKQANLKKEYSRKNDEYTDKIEQLRKQLVYVQKSITKTEEAQKANKVMMDKMTRIMEENRPPVLISPLTPLFPIQPLPTQLKKDCESPLIRDNIQWWLGAINRVKWYKNRLKQCTQPHEVVAFAADLNNIMPCFEYLMNHPEVYKLKEIRDLNVARDEQGNIIPGQKGEITILFDWYQAFKQKWHEFQMGENRKACNTAPWIGGVKDYQNVLEKPQEQIMYTQQQVLMPDGSTRWITTPTLPPFGPVQGIQPAGPLGQLVNNQMTPTQQNQRAQLLSQATNQAQQLNQSRNQAQLLAQAQKLNQLTKEIEHLQLVEKGQNDALMRLAKSTDSNALQLSQQKTQELIQAQNLVQQKKQEHATLTDLYLKAQNMTARLNRENERMKAHVQAQEQSVPVQNQGPFVQPAPMVIDSQVPVPNQGKFLVVGSQEFNTLQNMIIQNFGAYVAENAQEVYNGKSEDVLRSYPNSITYKFIELEIKDILTQQGYDVEDAMMKLLDSFGRGAERTLSQVEAGQKKKL